MLKALFLTTFITSGAFASAALAEGDAAAGEDLFKRCKACHTLADGDEVIMRGGRTGPNLFGVIGRQAGTYEGFRFGGDLVAAGEAGLVWDEETLAAFITDPTGYLRTYLDDSSARSKMSFKLRSGSEDMAAFLASLSTMEETDNDDDDENEEGESS